MPGDTQRRHRTGRPAILKVTPANRERFAQMADDAGVSLNVMFERALVALGGKSPKVQSAARYQSVRRKEVARPTMRVECCRYARLAILGA